MARRTPRRLTEEERALWNAVRRRMTPMRPPDPDPLQPASQPPPPRPQTRPDLAGFAMRGGRTPPTHDLLPSVPERLESMPVTMDAKAYQKMKRGRLRPDARIDLHGMTLAQAEPRLRAFILRAHTEGRRLVLVITGKGRDRPDDGPLPVPRGILRHQVPLWLRGGALGPVVLQVAEAHQSHGGGGAYYVYLRKR